METYLYMSRGSKNEHKDYFRNREETRSNQLCGAWDEFPYILPSYAVLRYLLNLKINQISHFIRKPEWRGLAP